MEKRLRAGIRHAQKEGKEMRRKRISGIAARLLLLLAVLALLAGMLLYKMHARENGETGTQETEGYRGETDGETGPVPESGTEEDAAEDVQEEKDTQEDTAADAQEETDTPEEDTQAAGTETGETAGTDTQERQPVTEREKYAVTVTNADEFAKQVMASRTWLLDKYLSEYVKKKKIRAGAGKILDVAVPDDSIRCTEFYVELDNKKHTLVTLRWDPYTCTARASRCRYTRQEIEARVWDSRGAAVTDISPEEDAAVIAAQGEQKETGPAPGKEEVVE